MIPYGRQYLDGDDIRAVAEALEDDWLTCCRVLQGQKRTAITP